MATNCNMESMPNPFYDKHSKAIYVCDKDDHHIHKFDQDEKWSIALENIKDNAVTFD